MVGEGARGAAVKYLSICSGIEAASVAWHDLQWQAVGFSEIEPFPCAVLSHRYPATPNFGDMTSHADWNIEPGAVDLVVGGTPCQAFSVAGLRAGLADPRGNLALTFLAIVDRLRPQWIVWENVPGVLSSNGGRDFGAFVGALVELGYGFAYRVLDAQHFGVAQRRRRVFVVANATDWRRAAAVLFEPESLHRDPASGRAKGQGAAASTGSRTPDGRDTVGTLMARDHKGLGNQDLTEGRGLVLEPSNAVRRLTPVECERLQGFPDDWTAIPYRGKPAADGPRYKAIGNSMAVPVMRWLGERIDAVDRATKVQP